jgi:hypothetical protein
MHFKPQHSSFLIENTTFRLRNGGFEHVLCTFYVFFTFLFLPFFFSLSSSPSPSPPSSFFSFFSLSFSLLFFLFFFSSLPDQHEKGADFLDLSFLIGAKVDRGKLLRAIR